MEKLTTLKLKEKKGKKEKVTMLTAYDYPTANLIDEAGVDLILVGDSLGMVILGYADTLSVTLEDMIHHGKAVVRGTKQAMVVVDMPFLTYQLGKKEAVRNAGRLIQETGCQAVKVEGGSDIADAVKSITTAGIPVMGHLGLTPQFVGQMGGFKVQGKNISGARKIIDDALKLQEANVFAIVLECVPAPLASLITEKLSVPTIGIGAGADCDGQVLVYHDLIGLYAGKKAKFVKQYMDSAGEMRTAVQRYISEVRAGEFPEQEHSFSISPSVLDELRGS